MNIVISGAGEVGRHTAEVLAPAGHSITIIDQSASKLAEVDELMDVGSLVGNCAEAQVQLLAGVDKADLFVAATNNDEVNLLSCSVAKGLGCVTAISRVHHSGFFEERGLNYAKHLGIDHLVCPEYTTAQAIAAALRSPGAIAVENFARGKVEMQRLEVSQSSKAVGVALRELRPPGTSLIACVTRGGEAFMPAADTVLAAGDEVTVLGEAKGFDQTSKYYNAEQGGRRKIMIMGGSTQSVWLCRELKRLNLSVRMLISDEARAKELAPKLEWVTTINADVINSDVLQEERVDLAHAFISATDDEETNILAAALAKTRGATVSMCVMQRPTYLHLIEHVGVDRAFSPRATAVAEILRLLDHRDLRHLGTLSEGIAELYEVHVTAKASQLIGKPLSEIKFPAHCLVAAISRGERVYIPGAGDVIEQGDTAVLIGPSEIEKELAKLFGTKLSKRAPAGVATV
ncbi:Trk system potassium transporter TrkA [Phycisphaeraceae bacterium D3-23]